MVHDRGGTVRNADAAWAVFDPDAYRGANYRVLRGDDRKILTIGAGHLASSGARDHVGIDVGAGANLYPALSMLPWCSRIVLLEYAPKNVDYLRRQVECLDDVWEPFWDVVGPGAGGLTFSWARKRFAEITVVERMSIFDVERRLVLSNGEVVEATMGTMHFVAESLSEEFSEFVEANRRFMGLLHVGRARPSPRPT